MTWRKVGIPCAKGWGMEMGKIEVQASAVGRGAAAEGRSASARDGNSGFRIEHSCVRCSRQMGARDVKVLLPRYVQERDPYVRHGVVKRRFMCLSCYNQLRASARAVGVARQVHAATC